MIFPTEPVFQLLPIKKKSSLHDTALSRYRKSLLHSEHIYLKSEGDLEILVSLSIKKTRREYSTMKVHGRFRTNKFSWITNRKREKMNQRKILL